MGPGDARSDQDDDADAVLLTPLGEFMQRRHAELGLSVAAVAKRVGMSRATWYRIARGESASPSVRLLRDLARVYKVRAAELFALAADADLPSSTARTRAPVATREAGDVLWRIRYEQQVRAAAWIDVHLALQNLSDQPWLAAEVRGIHDAWLLLGDDAARPSKACGQGRGQAACSAPLAPTRPGEWGEAFLTLRAPLSTGSGVFCLALFTGPSMQPTGTGAFLFIEAR